MKDLIIGKKEKQKLNKQQQTFNRLVKKLEKLRAESERTARMLGEKLDFYGKHIHPLEQNLANLRKEAVKYFYKFYKDEKSLGKKDRRILLELMAAQLSGVFQFSAEPPDEEIKEIFEVIEGVSYEQAAAEDFEFMKEDMAETFQEMGFDIDLEDFQKEMSEEDLMRKMAEMLGDLKEQAEARDAEPPKRRKTKKQIEKEEREKQIEAAKSKNIADIYKQLAKIFHPDLEPDPALKAQREDLMKQLTIAYKNGDLHTLLRLELEWIHKEEENLDRLSDEKLAIYNRVLKEQVAELEMEVFMLAQHPRYQPLQRFSFFPGGVKFVDLESERRKIELTIKDAQRSVAELQGGNALKELKEIISVLKKPKPKFKFSEVDLEQLFR